jgi:hypothetical protein
MAVMTVGPGGIETISGALKRPVKKDGHNHGLYFVATHRVKETANPNCQRVYSFASDRYKRSTPLTANERDARARFAEVAAAVKTRKGNLTTLSADQAAFLAQKDTAGGCVSFKQYLWKVCGDAYDAQH